MDQSIHFEFENGNKFSLGQDDEDIDFFADIISREVLKLNLKPDNNELVIENNADASKVKFIPCQFRLEPCPDGYYIKQYCFNFIKLPFNDKNQPYRLHFIPFGINSYLY